MRQGDLSRSFASRYRRMRGLAPFTCVFSLMPMHPVAAEIHDYMVLRLIYLGTSCGTQKLERIDAGRTDWRRFKVDCRDVAAYPHGIVVTCTDPEDDRSCKIETPPAAFESLKLLRPD